MAEAKKKGRPKKLPTTGSYEVAVYTMGRVFTETGGTVSEALAKLKVNNCRGKAIISVTKGDAKKERILMPIQASRLFTARGLTQEVALKNVSLLFQGL